MWRGYLNVVVHSAHTCGYGPASTALFLAVSLTMVLEGVYRVVHVLTISFGKHTSITYFLNGLIRVNLNEYKFSLHMVCIWGDVMLS